MIRSGSVESEHCSLSCTSSFSASSSSSFSILPSSTVVLLSGDGGNPSSLIQLEVVGQMAAAQFMQRQQSATADDQDEQSSVHDDGPSSLSAESSDVDGKKYYCQRCLNHSEYHARKGHKPNCRYATCACDQCRMVEERRQLNNMLSRRKLGHGNAQSALVNGKRIRDPKCARCGAHGRTQALRGHKKINCPFYNCDCQLCGLVENRRQLMARQIKLRRTQSRIDRVAPRPDRTVDAMQAELNAASARHALLCDANDDAAPSPSPSLEVTKTAKVVAPKPKSVPVKRPSLLLSVESMVGSGPALTRSSSPTSAPPIHHHHLRVVPPPVAMAALPLSMPQPCGSSSDSASAFRPLMPPMSATALLVASSPSFATGPPISPPMPPPSALSLAQLLQLSPPLSSSSGPVPSVLLTQPSPSSSGGQTSIPTDLLLALLQHIQLPTLNAVPSSSTCFFPSPPPPPLPPVPPLTNMAALLESIAKHTTVQPPSSSSLVVEPSSSQLHSSSSI